MDALDEFGTKYRDPLDYCSEVSSQPEGHENQLLQSVEQNNMPTWMLNNLNSFLKSAIIRLERKLEVQKAAFDFSAEQRSMQLEDFGSSIVEISGRLEEQCDISKQYLLQIKHQEGITFDQKGEINRLLCQLSATNKIITKKNDEIEDLQGQLDSLGQLHIEYCERWENRTIYIDELKSIISELRNNLEVSERAHEFDLKHCVCHYRR